MNKKTVKNNTEVTSGQSTVNVDEFLDTFQLRKAYNSILQVIMEEITSS